MVTQGGMQRARRHSAAQPRSATIGTDTRWRLGLVLWPALLLILLAMLAAPAAAERGATGFSDEDIRLGREAMDAFKDGNYAQGAALRERVSDPLARELITWYGATQRESALPFRELTAFRAAHEDWPLRARLLNNIDDAVRPDTDPQQIYAWYRENTAETQEGRIDAIERLRRAGMAGEAAAIARNFWRNSRIGRREQAEFLQRYASMLRPEDHAARVNYLLLWNRKRDAEQLLSAVALEPPYRQAAQARLLMRARATRNDYGRIAELLGQIPLTVQREQGMHYDMMRWHRRTGRVPAAILLLDEAPAENDRPDRWFKERNIHVRLAVRTGDAELAYRLARDHRQAGKELHSDAEWLAGFVALRFLNRPDVAQGHFQTALEHADDARGVSRAAFWLGQTAKARRDFDGERRYYEIAARLPTTFYGQIANTELGVEEFDLAPVESTDETRQQFWAHPFTRGFVYMARTGRGVHARIMGLYSLLHAVRSSEQAEYIIERTVNWYPESQRRRMEVRMVRYAHYRGYPVRERGFPRIELPVENLVDPSLVYALIRQESEFLPTARSWVGARGLMQLMPFTARAEARDLGVPFAVGRLTADPDYNLRLGTHHMARLMGLHEGSYPLVLAAYNAGTGRVTRWLRDYGDPRRENGRVDWVTWIELIPFDETRDYVKRVLEGYTVYRLRHGTETRPAQLVSYWAMDWDAVLRACQAGESQLATAGSQQTAVPDTGNATDAAQEAAEAEAERAAAEDGEDEDGAQTAEADTGNYDTRAVIPNCVLPGRNRN